MKPRIVPSARLSFPLASAIAALLAVQSVSAITYVWQNSNAASAGTRDWFTGGPNTLGVWSPLLPVSNNTNTIQFYQDTTTALTNGGSFTVTSNINNGGVAFELGTLTLSGLANATNSRILTTTISGNALNFSAATGTINLDSLINGRSNIFNVNSAIQLGTASSAGALTLAGNGTGTFNIANITELQVGGGSLVKSGSSAVTLTGANNFTGTTTVSGGTLLTNTATALPGYNTVAGRVIFSGGALSTRVGGAGWTMGQVDDLLSNATKTSGTLGIDTTNASLTQWTGFNTSNFGGIGLTKLGTNTLTLNQANTFTGATGLNASILELKDVNAIGSSTSMTQLGGSTLQLKSDTTATFNVPLINLQANGSSVTYDVSNNGSGTGQTLSLSNGIFSNQIGGNDVIYNVTSSNGYALSVPLLRIERTGSGGAGATHQLTPTTGKLFVGSVTSPILVQNTALQLKGSAVGNTVGDITNTGASNLSLVVNSTGTWTLTGANSYKGTTTLTAGTLILGHTNALSSTALTITAGTLDSSVVDLVNAGNNTQTWNGNFAFTGTNSLNLGTGAVGLGSAAGSRTVTVNANTLTVGGVISNSTATGLTKAGNGTLKLTGNNGYTGATTINAGTLNANSTAALGNSSGTNTLLFNGGTLQAGGNINSVSTRGVTLNTTPSTTATIDTNGNDVIIAGNIGGTGSLTKTGAGTLTLSGTNDISFSFNALSVVNQGTLLATKSASLMGYNFPSAWEVDSGATLAVRAGGAGEWSSAEIDSVLGGDGTSDFFYAGSNLGIEVTGSNTFTYANDIAGTTGGVATPSVDGLAKGLVKFGTGTLTLSGTNTYTGATTVSAGTLELVGGSQSSPITVNNLASLGFTLGSGTTSTSTVSFSAGSTVKITGTPAPATSYTLMTASSFTGITPVLDTPITGFQLLVDGGNTLKLVPVAGGYASWKAINAPGAGIGTTPGEDYDGDGVTNAVEYVLGGDKDTNDLSKLPTIDASGSDLVFSFKRDQDSIDGTTSLAIQVGTTLASWPYSYTVPGTALANNPGVTVEKDIPAVGTDTITLRVVKSPDAAKFVRLIVTPAP